MIRKMTEADLPEVVALENRYFSMPWSEANLRESMQKEHYLFLVAEEEGMVVGYGGILWVADEGDITNIVVLESYRGLGLGTALMKALLSAGRVRGITSFTLEVRMSNQVAIHTYERLGFVGEGVRKRFYEMPTEDALIMWKREPEQ